MIMMLLLLSFSELIPGVGDVDDGGEDEDAERPKKKKKTVGKSLQTRVRRTGFVHIPPNIPQCIAGMWTFYMTKILSF